jgi:hypothetical protein
VFDSGGCLFGIGGRCGEGGVEVADHPSIDDVGEVAFEDPHRFCDEMDVGCRRVWARVSGSGRSPGVARW